jgi:hypothetical protein
LLTESMATARLGRGTGSFPASNFDVREAIWAREKRVEWRGEVGRVGGIISGSRGCRGKWGRQLPTRAGNLGAVERLKKKLTRGARL